MFYVGIDIAKNTHWTSIMSSDGEVIKEPFSFSNDNSGFQKFISNLESLDKTKILIGLESTAHYVENIISYLFNLDYKIGLINPIQTSNLRKSNIRKTKNDKVDTYIIIKALTLGNYSLITSRDINNLKLKGLCRSRRNLVTMRSKAKIQLVSYLDQISSLHLTKISNILHDNSHGRYGKQDAIRLRELAKDSVGIDNPSLSLQTNFG